MATAITEEPTAALPMFGVFCFGKGVGNVFAGPINAAMLLPLTDVGTYGALRYKAVVVFTGTCMLLSSVSIVTWCLRPMRQGFGLRRNTSGDYERVDLRGAPGEKEVAQ